MKPEDGIVARVDKARQLLAEAKDAREAKQVADLARAAEVYAKRQKLGEECIAYATAVKVDAMTLMGEMILQSEKNKGGGNGSNQHRRATSAKSEEVAKRPTLPEQGIPHRTSSDAQVLAKAKEKAPEVYEQVRAGKATPTQARAELKRQEKREELKAKAEAAVEVPAPESWSIIEGDCVEELPKLAEQARLIFADPPYNIGIDYGHGHNDNQDDTVFLSWCEQWMRAAHGRLTTDGSMWVLINDEYAAEFAVILKRIGLTIRSWIIWYETFGVNCTDKFNRTKRHLFHAVRNPKRFVFNTDTVSRPSDRQAKYNDARANPSGKLLDDVWLDIPRLTGTASERIPDFPTQLPLALLRRIIACATDPGDVVLDPFNGSGTTGAASIELGRSYIGIERSPDFAKIARTRLKGVRFHDAER